MGWGWEKERSVPGSRSRIPSHEVRSTTVLPVVRRPQALTSLGLSADGVAPIFCDPVGPKQCPELTRA